MNYYQARQRPSNGVWHWTKMNDGKIWPVGACADATCIHKTPEEAELHEAERIRDVILVSLRHKIDTNKGRHCFVETCETKAFHYVNLDLDWRNFVGCDEHLKDPPVKSLIIRSMIASS